MATGWAVGAAATLGLCVGLTLAGAEAGHADAFRHPGALPFVAPLVFGAWAYAVSMGSHGSKGALAALAAYAGVGGVAFGAAHLTRCLPGSGCPPQVAVLAALCALVGAATLHATVSEMRRRRGAVRWGDAAFLSAPLAFALVLYLVVNLA